MNVLKDYKYILSVAVLIAVLAISALLLQKPQESFGSVEVGAEYQSTTTPAVATGTNLCPARSGYASSTTGALGSVNVLIAGTGRLRIVDATTTNATLRATAATSSLLLADFPSATAGSYHFDVTFKNGLLIDTSANVPTTTISYRCQH